MSEPPDVPFVTIAFTFSVSNEALVLLEAVLDQGLNKVFIWPRFKVNLPETTTPPVPSVIASVAFCLSIHKLFNNRKPLVKVTGFVHTLPDVPKICRLENILPDRVPVPVIVPFVVLLPIAKVLVFVVELPPMVRIPVPLIFKILFTVIVLAAIKVGSATSVMMLVLALFNRVKLLNVVLAVPLILLILLVVFIPRK